MKEHFLVVSRTIDDEIEILPIFDDLKMALKAQKAIIVGMPIELSWVSDKEYKQAEQSLMRNGIDRICNDEQEVYIFRLPSRDFMR